MFEDVSGQPQVTVTLKNELKLGRINHAYLFTGSRGTGKTTCAKIMAKAVNCLNPKDGNPCCECDICKGIDNGSVMDIAEIDAASNNGVDNIRAIIEEAAFAPAKAKYRVYIIDEVHMLSPGAFNALLKTLEEPPAHVIFILATTEVHKIPATILSRCQRLDFHRIALKDIADRLCFVAERENVVLDREAAMIIAAVSDGAMRDALSLLDRCISEDTHITAKLVQSTAGLLGRKHIFELADCIIDRNTGRSLEITEKLYSESKDMGRLCEELIEHFRCLMLTKTMKNADTLVTFSSDEKERALLQADRLSVEDIIYVIDVLQNGYDRISKGLTKKSDMELMLIKLTSPKLNISAEAILSRVAALERAVKRGLSFRPQDDAPSDKNTDKSITAEDEANVSVVSDGTAKEETSVSQKNTSADYDEIIKNAVPMEDWQEVLDILKSYSMTIATSFKNTEAYISGDYILIDSRNELAFRLLKQPAHRERMRRAVKEVTGRTYKLGPYRKAAEKAQKNDPMQELLNKAKQSGVIVEED